MARHRSGGRDGHSSGTPVTRRLKQPTRAAGPDGPKDRLPCLAPLLFGFAPGGVYLAVSVAGAAVRSYRTFSPLLAFTLAGYGAAGPEELATPKQRSCEGERFVLCGTFPGVAPAGCYPAPYINGARTFLPGDLSILAGAAVQPTYVAVMGAHAREVKR